MSRALFAPHALLPSGWARDVLLAWDDVGTLTHVAPDTAPPVSTEVASGPLLPGLPNLHSHAFQRAFAGLSEYRGSSDDSFWTWRDLMYRFALSVSPDQLEDIATHGPRSACDTARQSQRPNRAQTAAAARSIQCAQSAIPRVPSSVQTFHS